jgi:nuclear cap-binding protein subunit 1
MHQLVFNRKEAAHYLIDLPQYFPTGLFHRPGLAIKDLPTPNPARPKFKLEDIIVDSVFAALFTLPTPQEREMFYAALLTEITKLAPQDIAPTLGRAIRWVYGRLDDVVGELDMRFSSWFAIHLSNFGFTYKWDEWYVFI